jgi:hypothetical protein
MANATAVANMKPRNTRTSPRARRAPAGRPAPGGGDLDRGEPEPQRTGEERPCGGRIPASAEEDVDHLAVLVDRAVQVGPAGRRPSRTFRQRTSGHNGGATARTVRHISEGGFDQNRYVVADLDERTAAAFVRQHHYAASWPSTRFRFGMYDLRDAEAPRLVAVIALGVPMSNEV